MNVHTLKPKEKHLKSYMNKMQKMIILILGQMNVGFTL